MREIIGTGERRSSGAAGAGAVVVVAMLTAGMLMGCAGGRDALFEDGLGGRPTDEAPLTGEALAQRRMDLDRAWRDLRHFDVTLRSLTDRRDGRSIALLDDFLSQYLFEHLDPLLAPGWQSAHPELMELDANLRFMKAQILTDMRYTRLVQRAIDDIEGRFQGRENMLVEYPAGEQHALGEAITILREQKWGG